MKKMAVYIFKNAIEIYATSCIAISHAKYTICCFHVHVCIYGVIPVVFAAEKTQEKCGISDRVIFVGVFMVIIF